MNELIKQAAEDCYGKETYSQPISKEVRLSRYGAIVTHFLSFAKEKGFELVRVEEDVKKLANELFPDYENPSNAFNPAVPLFQREAFILGAAKEREQMVKFAEWASSVSGYDYNELTNQWLKIKKTSQYYIDRSDYSPQINDYDYKTTSELIKIFNNENNRP